MNETYPTINVLHMEDLKIEIPYVERELPGSIRTYVHALTFQEFAQAKRLALNYAMIKQNLSTLVGAEPDPDVLIICQIILACKTEPHGALTFAWDPLQEVPAIDALMKFLPHPVVKMLQYDSDVLSLSNYVPLEDMETKNNKEKGKETLMQLLVDPKVWEHFNYLCIEIFGQPIMEVNDLSIGDALNVLNRHEKVQTSLIEALYNFMQAMSTSAATGGL